MCGLFVKYNFTHQDKIVHLRSLKNVSLEKRTIKFWAQDDRPREKLLAKEDQS